MSSSGPKRAPVPSASRSTAMAADASGDGEDAISPREAGTGTMKVPHPRVGSTDNAGRGENPVAPDGVLLPVTTRVPTQRVEAPVTAGGGCLMGLTQGFPGLVIPSVLRRMASRSGPRGARCQGATWKGFPLALGAGGETPPPVPRDAGADFGDKWGKPPVRGDTTPQHEPGTGLDQSRNTPLGG